MNSTAFLAKWINSSTNDLTSKLQQKTYTNLHFNNNFLYNYSTLIAVMFYVYNKKVLVVQDGKFWSNTTKSIIRKLTSIPGDSGLVIKGELSMVQIYTAYSPSYSDSLLHTYFRTINRVDVPDLNCLTDLYYMLWIHIYKRIQDYYNVYRQADRLSLANTLHSLEHLSFLLRTNAISVPNEVYDLVTELNKDKLDKVAKLKIGSLVESINNFIINNNILLYRLSNPDISASTIVK